VRLAILADIHGNLPALEAVLADLRTSPHDAVWNLGDHVSGPLWAAATADLLIDSGMTHVRGNHDRQLLAPAEGMGPSDRAAYAEMRPAHFEWLAALPATLVRDGILLCHGTPARDDVYLLEEPDGRGLSAVEQIEERLAGEREPVILCGHSHIPRVVTLAGGQLVVNPGSVGLPAYEADGHLMECGSPHARYAMIEIEQGVARVDLRAIEYDWRCAERRAVDQGRPDWAVALRTGYARGPAPQP
jgi:putative phosphoesterase